MARHASREPAVFLTGLLLLLRSFYVLNSGKVSTLHIFLFLDRVVKVSVRRMRL